MGSLHIGGGPFFVPFEAVGDAGKDVKEAKIMDK